MKTWNIHFRSQPSKSTILELAWFQHIPKGPEERDTETKNPRLGHAGDQEVDKQWHRLMMGRCEYIDHTAQKLSSGNSGGLDVDVSSEVQYQVVSCVNPVPSDFEYAK